MGYLMSDIKQIYFDLLKHGDRLFGWGGILYIYYLGRYSNRKKYSTLRTYGRDLMYEQYGIFEETDTYIKAVLEDENHK